MHTSTIQLVRDITAGARREGHVARDMSAAGALELTHIGAPPPTSPDQAAPGEIFVWLEHDPAAPRPVKKRSSVPGFRYFLDGTQRTLPCWNVGSIPIVLGFVAAGVLERDEFGRFRIMPGMLAAERFGVAPLRSGNAAINHLCAGLRDDGLHVFDPLEAMTDDEDAYRASLDNFGQLMSLAYQTVLRQRERLEARLLGDWLSSPRQGALMVDGSLRGEAPNVVGVVKSFTRQYVSGPEATALFGLAMNERSAAFEVHPSHGRHAPVIAWYQRFWSPDGKDPRHALVRVETSAAAPAGTIDEIAGWLMDERAPRAANDARWPTLLYPIHYLENVLKQHLNAETRGWPGL